MVFCFDSVSVNASAGALRRMLLPAPIVAPEPTVTGAISCVSEPMNASSSMVVWCLFAPS